MDHYAVLGLSADSSPDEVTEQYRVLKRLYQSTVDTADDDRTVKRLREIDEAYVALSQSSPRSKVIETGDHQAIQAGAFHMASPPPPASAEYVPPTRREPLAFSQRVALYALLFVVLVACLVISIRRGFEVTSQSAASPEVSTTIGR